MLRPMLSLAIVACAAFSGGCSKCDANKATNKMLALNKIQARFFAKGGEGLEKFAVGMTSEIGPVSELIAQQRYDDACKLADDIAAKYKFNLDAEQKGMITAEQLAKDGGKGTGGCSIGDAATKQMELHALLQKEVEAGRKGPDIFNTFNDDTRGYAEMLATDPSKACELFESLRKKYGLEK